MTLRPTSDPLRPATHRQAGLTLVEMLVAMVILGFVMTLVSEVVFQVSQVARAADAVTRGSSARWSGGWSAGSLFANLLIPEDNSDDPVLTGSSRQVTGYTSQPLDGGERGIERFQLELRPSGDDTRSTDMVSVPITGREVRREPAVVAVFPGRAEFAFIDLAGQSQFTWPPLARSEKSIESLPQAIVVKDADSGKLLMWYGFQGEITKRKPALDMFGGARR